MALLFARVMDSPSTKFSPLLKFVWAPLRRLGHKYFLTRKFRYPDSARQLPSLKSSKCSLFNPYESATQHFLARATKKLLSELFICAGDGCWPHGLSRDRGVLYRWATPAWGQDSRNFVFLQSFPGADEWNWTIFWGLWVPRSTIELHRHITLCPTNNYFSILFFP